MRKFVDLPGEQALIERAKRDPQAFREVYRHYHPRLFAYIAYRVGRAEDAEDITADVFVRVVAGLRRFEWRGDGAFSAWLFRIAYNELNRYFEHSQRHNMALSLDELPEVGDGDRLGSQHTLDQLVLRKEQFAQLREAIGTLSPRRQEIITLKFFGELRNKEIAEVLGLDERTIAAHLCRAVEDLQRWFKHAEQVEKVKRGDQRR